MFWKLKTLSFNIIFSLILISCASGIPDSVISDQVKEYLLKDTREGFFQQVNFSDFFEVENIIVKDKLTKEKEMTAVCNITLRIKEKYDGSSSVTAAYRFIVGNEPGSAGQTRSSDVKFLFEKNESGMLIKGMVQ